MNTQRRFLVGIILVCYPFIMWVAGFLIGFTGITPDLVLSILTFFDMFTGLSLFIGIIYLWKTYRLLYLMEDITCPECDKSFSYPKKRSKVRCQHCGAVGEK